MQNGRVYRKKGGTWEILHTPPPQKKKKKENIMFRPGLLLGGREGGQVFLLCRLPLLFMGRSGADGEGPCDRWPY